MRILIVHQYFTTNDEPGASKMFDLAMHLSKKGHKVWVLAGNQNYITGIEQKVSTKSFGKNLRVKYCRVFGKHQSNVFEKFLSQQSFMANAVLAAKKIPKIDVVLASSPPLQCGLAGLAIAKMKKAKLVFEIRDLWPDSVIKLGILKNKIIIKTSKWIERKIYENSDKIVCLTFQQKEKLVQKKIGRKKIVAIPNGVDLELFRPKNVEKKFGKNFTALYAGPMGPSYGLSEIMKAAKYLKKEKNILIAFLGGGKDEKNLVEFSKKNRLENVRFLGNVPKSGLPEAINSADICIVSLKKAAIGETIPNKMLEYMACGKATISNSGTITKIAKENDCILVAEKPKDFANAIIKLKNDKKLREKMGKNGRKLVEKNFNRKKLIKEYEKEILKTVRM